MRNPQPENACRFPRMSSIQVSYMDHSSTPEVYSAPPYVDSDDKERPAKIVVQPWGPTKHDAEAQSLTTVTLYYSIEEAEALGKQILAVVEAARRGQYSPVGEELANMSGRRRQWPDSPS
jgi:hypothetical protein